MILTPNQISDALRKCGQTNVCEGCPYQGRPDCKMQLMSDAADIIDVREMLS